MIILKNGNVVCKRCNGEGIKFGHFCSRCRGTGQLDWIEAIIEKTTIHNMVVALNKNNFYIYINDLNIGIDLYGRSILTNYYAEHILAESNDLISFVRTKQLFLELC